MANLFCCMQKWKKLKTPIYEFTEKALKRKFGKSWFEKLKLIAKKYQKA